ncbi:Misato segment II tubulin-like domain-containing protein [Mycena amicta]|nr:Misato segment II tubulin-like domain-containing protein [Mycena amicta]
MKEILYIQAGSRANYVGTHFWNTQESYLSRDEAVGPGEEAEVDHGVSFREGLNHKGESTFCPRLLVFDHKVNFGSLSQSNALYGMEDNDETVSRDNIPWSGNTVAYRQEPIEKSQYQTDIDFEELFDENDVSSGAQLRDIRFWSDFNRMYYVPRTVQKVPDLPEWEWEEGEGNWAVGHETFVRYDENTGLMEGPVRSFLEECDMIQGIQLTHETARFGSFINSLLVSLRDEGAKIPVMAFPMLSAANAFSQPQSRSAWRKTLNDALVLRGLSELAVMTVPVQHPTEWQDQVCDNTYIHANPTHIYHSSAILSAHIESATLPLRLKSSADDVLGLSGQLCEGLAPFSELSGAFPLSGSDADASRLDGRIYDLSCSAKTRARLAATFVKHPHQVPFYLRRNVTRGFSPAAKAAYEELLAKKTERWTLGSATSTHAGAYPLPTSFPAFFRLGSNAPDSDTQLLTRPRSTALFSSLGPTQKMPLLLEEYARILEDHRDICLQAAQDIGLERDEVAELAVDLWGLRDRYPDVDGVESDAGGGEDGD